MTATTPALLTVTRPSPARWRVTFDAPPFNLVTPELVAELHDVVTALEADDEVKVVVFDSADDAFFLSHFDLARAAEFPLLPDGRPMWTDMVARLAQAPVVSIAAIRGRTRGGGDELALACDLRYASTERAIFGQPEVGVGILPGGGASERLPHLAGRDRALEVILSSQDYDAETAERFGWVTRALPDAELDAFVDALAERIAGFDRQALGGAKARVDLATLPTDEALYASYDAYFASLAWPGYASRGPRLVGRFADHGADVELRLGRHIGEL
jgi:enoyl-CoA hydratase/carnithine racemase